MSRPWKLVPLLLASALVCGACSAGPTRLRDLSHTGQPVAIRAVQLPHRPHVTEQGCSDVTASYPHDFAIRADHLMADWLDGAVQSNQDGVTAYVSLIDSMSYDPISTPLVIMIPATPPDPQPPTLAPLPTPTGNPYTDGQLRAQIQAQNDQAMRRYQEALAAEQAQLDAIRWQVHDQTNKLRALDPPVASRTDVWGCLKRASERLSGEPGNKIVLIASDMENNTRQDYVPNLSLAGASVWVIMYQCSRAPECAAKTKQWRGIFSSAGAQDVRFFDPAQTQTLHSPLEQQTGGATV